MTASPLGTYENDILGNRTWQNRYSQTAVARRMEWDELNRMTSACTQGGGARYEYRADGMRTLKVEGLSLVWQELQSEEKEEEGSGFYDSVWATNKPTTRYFYDGQMPIEDDFTRLVNSVVTVDVTRNALGARGIDQIEKTTSTATTTVFPLYDGHGNMAATLSRAGTGFAVNDRRTFDAWGLVRTGASTGDPKGRYCANLGHVQDDESGLVYMRARYYEASTGRFVSQDPGKDKVNWFVYCRNNPVALVDQDGMVAHVPALVASWILLGVQVGASLAGYYAGFMMVTMFLKQDFPGFEPDHDYLALMIGVTGAVGALVFGPGMNPGKQGLGNLLGKWGARLGGLAFVIGFASGAYSARLAFEMWYERHWDEVPW